jgi:hypothetical protein
MFTDFPGLDTFFKSWRGKLLVFKGNLNDFRTFALRRLELPFLDCIDRCIYKDWASTKQAR